MTSEHKWAAVVYSYWSWFFHYITEPTHYMYKYFCDDNFINTQQYVSTKLANFTHHEGIRIQWQHLPTTSLSFNFRYAVYADLRSSLSTMIMVVKFGSSVMRGDAGSVPVRRPKNDSINSLSTKSSFTIGICTQSEVAPMAKLYAKVAGRV